MTIRAINPLFNYDGEPSVSNGIVSQLPSSYLPIHRVPVKPSMRVFPYGESLYWLQLLFISWSYWSAHSTGYGYFVNVSPAFFCWSFCDVVPTTPSLSGFFPKTCPTSDSSETRQDPGIRNALWCLALQPFPSFLCVWCLNVFFGS